MQLPSGPTYKRNIAFGRSDGTQRRNEIGVPRPRDYIGVIGIHGKISCNSIVGSIIHNLYISTHARGRTTCAAIGESDGTYMMIMRGVEKGVIRVTISLLRADEQII